MKQEFQTLELRKALERSLGFRLKSLVRLDGASAINFRAERESDGLVFAVKCSPPSRQVMFDHLVRHLEEVKGTKAVRRLFEGECPSRFAGYNLVCLSWCPGERLFPDRLTDGQMKDFLDDYLVFSAAMQKATGIVPHDPVPEWRADVLSRCGTAGGRLLRRLILRDIPVESVTYRAERLRVVHGDFHHGNFLFTGGRVSGYFDLEEFCEGYPADDIVRYFVCAAEHLRWYEQHRKRRLLELFAFAVRYLPYPRDEWHVALNCLLMRKIYMKTHHRRIGLGQTLNLLYRAGFYRRLRSLCA